MSSHFLQDAKNAHPLFDVTQVPYTWFEQRTSLKLRIFGVQSGSRDGEILASAGGVDVEIDKVVSRIKLAAAGMGVDSLTPEQGRFLASWQE
jgi:hypothetical protein